MKKLNVKKYVRYIPITLILSSILVVVSILNLISCVQEEREITQVSYRSMKFTNEYIEKSFRIYSSLTGYLATKDSGYIEKFKEELDSEIDLQSFLLDNPKLDVTKDEIYTITAIFDLTKQLHNIEYEYLRKIDADTENQIKLSKDNYFAISKELSKQRKEFSDVLNARINRMIGIAQRKTGIAIAYVFIATILYTISLVLFFNNRKKIYIEEK